MFTGEIVEILESKAACLPGSRDLDGRPLIIVYVPAELQPWTKDNLDLTLQYFSSIFSQETRRRGFTVLVDGQKNTWRVAKACIRLVSLSLGSDLACLIVLRPDAFWDKQRVDNCTKIRKEGEPIFIPISRLCKYVYNSQLTEEFGGTWTYNHDQWIRNRLNVEFFMKEAKAAVADLEKFHQKLNEFTTGERLSTATDPFVFSKQNFDTNKLIAQKILQSGRALISEIEKTDKECQKNNPNDYKTPKDAIDTKAKIEKMIELVEEKQEAIDGSWLRMEKKCVDAREIVILETRVSKVTEWILGTAETLLNSQQDVGYDVPSSEELRAEHETLELQCRETYGQYAELLHKIDTLPEVNIKIPADLKSQRDFMDFVCRSFATRLERRRNILITSLRFYRLVTEYFERTSEVFETLVMCTDVECLESAFCKLQELQENQTNIDFLAKELVKEGEKLSDMLSMPVKDALGRDMAVNYESDIVNVQEILEATLSRKQLFSDSVDLQKLTLEQVTHIHSYEKDAKQAVQWLNDLFEVMMKEYLYVGCNIQEIQMMKEELQAFQETARGTYEYGCQLLNAALALRHSCKLSDEFNIELTQNLCQAWKRLQTIGQEQMTRLRVSAVFHRSMEEHCKRLKDLKVEVQDLNRTEDVNDRKLKIRKFLHCREKLLLEVGRMVRLGRLLKTRLKEPVSTDQVSLGDGHLTSVEAIINKVSEVTSLAEQLDVALSAAQSENSGTNAAANNAAVVLNCKKLLEETTSAAAEDLISNLKSTKTPNTSNDSKSEDEFVTASECTCTPPSRSSSFQTASDGGAISPWWELDSPSDSEERTKLESSSETAKRVVRSPLKIIEEIKSDEAPGERITNNIDSCLNSHPIENPKSILRSNAFSMTSEPISKTNESCADEIVRQLSEIVKEQETFLTPFEESSESKRQKSEFKFEGDTFSQYSLEPLGSEDISTQNHSKSQSFETDNTDSSTPKFKGEPILNDHSETPNVGDHSKINDSFKQSNKRFSTHSNRWDSSFPQNLINDESAKIYIIDTSTPSPKSKRYVDSSLDSLEFYQQPIRKIVEAEIHRQEDSLKSQEDCNKEDFIYKMQEVRDRRRPVTTINLQNACPLPIDYHYQSQIAKMAIKGVF